jgi:hypothetical protein
MYARRSHARLRPPYRPAGPSFHKTKATTTPARPSDPTVETGSHHLQGASDRAADVVVRDSACQFQRLRGEDVRAAHLGAVCERQRDAKRGLGYGFAGFRLAGLQGHFGTVRQAHGGA